MTPADIRHAERIQRLTHSQIDPDLTQLIAEAMAHERDQALARFLGTSEALARPAVDALVLDMRRDLAGQADELAATWHGHSEWAALLTAETEIRRAVTALTSWPAVPQASRFHPASGKRPWPFEDPDGFDGLLVEELRELGVRP